MKNPEVSGTDTGSTTGAGGAASSSSEERIRAAGEQAIADAKRHAESTLERGKHTASETATRTAEALQQTADNLSEQGQDGLAQVVGTLARQLSTLAEGIERRSLDDLTREARQLARNNPAMFIAGGLAIGVALSRFFKAHARPSYGYESGGYETGGDYQTGGYQSGAYESAGSESTGTVPGSVAGSETRSPAAPPAAAGRQSPTTPASETTGTTGGRHE